MNIWAYEYLQAAGIWWGLVMYRDKLPSNCIFYFSAAMSFSQPSKQQHNLKAPPSVPRNTIFAETKEKTEIIQQIWGVWDMSKPHVTDPDSVQLAPVSKYLGNGGGNGVLNDWNPLQSGLMHVFPDEEVPVLVVALPMPCCSDGGGRAPPGHTAPLAARGTRWSFPAAHPGHLILASTQPVPSLPRHSHPLSASGRGRIVYPESKQKLNLSLHWHPAKETSENSYISFSAILRIAPRQRGVTKVKPSNPQKRWFFFFCFKIYLLIF